MSQYKITISFPIHVVELPPVLKQYITEYDNIFTIDVDENGNVLNDNRFPIDLVFNLFSKVSDTFSYTIVKDDVVISEVEPDYVPDFFPNDGEDYVDLDFKVENGKLFIRNWKFKV